MSQAERSRGMGAAAQAFHVVTIGHRPWSDLFCHVIEAFRNQVAESFPQCRSVNEFDL